MKNRKFNIPVTCEANGIVKVKAKSLEQTLILAKQADLPDDWDFVDGTFEVDLASVDYYNENGLSFCED